MATLLTVIILPTSSQPTISKALQPPSPNAGAAAAVALAVNAKTKPAPDFDKEVLAPLRTAQAAEAVAAAALAAQQAAAAALAAQQAQVSAQPVYAAPTAAYSGSLADWLYKLRTCESGGNYAENTGNGFYGAYQFTIDTWNHWQTGYARADYAPASVQDATIIENTNNTAGLRTQNPGCYAKTGISNYPPSS